MRESLCKPNPAFMLGTKQQAESGGRGDTGMLGDGFHIPWHMVQITRGGPAPQSGEPPAIWIKPTGGAMLAQSHLDRLQGILRAQTERNPVSITELIVIASSSRGGSSFFAEVLRLHPDLLHFPAEINPYLMVEGLGYPRSGTGSDALHAGHANADVARLLLSQAGSYRTQLRSGDWEEAFIRALCLRLSLQWPNLEFEYERIANSFERAWARVGETGKRFPTQPFHAAFLAEMRRIYPGLNAHYYDINRDLIHAYGGTQDPPLGPPGDCLLEEVPFVTIEPWQFARQDDSRGQLVVKTPSNCYRLEFLRALFPQARLRILHLKRNPLSSVNGLGCGWTHHGFFSHQVEDELRIPGYSERGPWGNHWWNFDLPPGWRDWTQAPLVDVCSYQWRSAHEATLDYLQRHPDTDLLSLRFEDFIRDRPSREAALKQVTDWLGVDLEPLRPVIEVGLPPVMQTDRPSKGRWRRNIQMLEPVLRNEPLWEVAERLGYRRGEEDHWI